MNRDVYGSIHQQYRAGCVFCDPAAVLVLDASPNFRVCFDVAPLAPGHLIIHSREHYGCAAEVPPTLFDELMDVRQATLSRLRAAFGEVTLYEHGRAGHCLSDGPEHRLCHHFHLHCVPGDLDVSEELTGRFQRRRMASYEVIGDLYEEHGPYLYLETGGGDMTYFAVSHEIERHLMRTLISRRLGRPERADWREYRGADLLVQGMSALSHRYEDPLPAVRPAPGARGRRDGAGDRGGC